MQVLASIGEYIVELKEFISTALSEIVAGVSEAGQSAKEHGAKIGSMELYGFLAINKTAILRKNTAE